MLAFVLGVKSDGHGESPGLLSFTSHLGDAHPARHSIRRLGLSLEILNRPLGQGSVVLKLFSLLLSRAFLRREMLNTLAVSFPREFLSSPIPDSS